MATLELRRDAFEALRDTAAPLRILADSVTDCAMYLLDAQGRVATWNSGADRLKQYSADEIIGQHFSCFYMPEDIAAGRPAAMLATALADGRAEDEGWRQRKDGTTFWAHDVVTPIFDSIGKHLGFGRVTRDISRDMSQVHMRSVLDHVLDGIVSTDAAGCIRSFNLAAEHIFGYTQAEVIGQDVKLLMPEQVHGAQDSYSGGYLRAGADDIVGTNRQVTGRRHDGSTFPMELAINEFSLEGQRYFTGIMRDVSSRTLAEDALRSSQQRMESAQQLAHIGDWEIDLATDEVTWSDELCRIYGIAPGLKEHYKSTLDLIVLEDREQVAAAIAGAALQGRDFQVEYRIQRPDGAVRHLEALGGSILDGAGAPQRLHGSVQDITDRKLAEESLRHSKQRMENAQRVAHIGDWEWDIGQDQLAWSDEYYRIFGLEPQSLSPDLAQWLDLIHPEDRDRLAAAMREVVATKGDLQFDHRLVRPDGTLRYVEGRGKWMAGYDGRPVATGVVYDVTDRVNEELSLRAILENVPDSIFMVDNRGLIRSINHAGEEMTGYRIAEIIGQPIQMLWPAEQRPQIDELLGRLFGGEQARASGLEVLGQRKDSTVFPIDLSLNEFAFGEEHYVIGVCRDATSRRDREARLAAILDNVTEAIVTLDEDGIVQSFNQAAEHTYGYKEAEMIGQSSYSLTSAGEQKFFENLVQRMCRGEQAQAQNMEATGLRKDGSTFPLEVSLSEFSLEDKRYVISMSHDATPRKKLEDQLRQGQKMEAVGKLAGGVAHDFNNMLTVINAYSEMALAKVPAASPEHDYLTQVCLAGERAALITQQLLAFSRQQVLAPRVLDLNSVVEETEKMLQRLIGEDISMASTLDPQLSQVLVDQSQMVQVIMNLAVNARDAMPQGGKLTIKTSNFLVTHEYARELPDYRPGPHVMLSVSDSGMGMSQEVQQRIFEPFYTTKALGEGTGLGLATVYGIIKQSGGHIEVYSEQGIGTTFKIYFPAVAEEDARHEMVEAVKSHRGTETVLLVEDDAAVRQVATTVLGAQGYNLLVASSGREALQLARSHVGPIDLLLTDLIMPEMSGRQVAEAIAPLLPGVKVMFMSGYTDDAVVRHGLVSAAVAFLQKPFTSTSLARKVREVLDAVA